MTRRKLLRTLAGASAPLGGFGAAVYGRYCERHHLICEKVSLHTNRTTPLRIAVLGDLHFDPLFEIDYLDSVVFHTNALAADIVLFTGDFVSKSAARLEELASSLENIRAPLGKFAVLGNHDLWVDADLVAHILERAAITVLRNRCVPLPDSPNWFLTGMESFWAGSPDLRTLEATPPDSQHILLVHEPDSFDVATDSRIALQVSGHTHGGQIRLPGVGALQLPSWGRKYQTGLYRSADRLLYVNRGIGTVDHHYRINCRPEVTVLELA